MRKYKIRFWSNDSQQMYYGLEHSPQLNLLLYLNGVTEGNAIMRDIGLRDRDNELIYEGDVIEYWYADPHTKYRATIREDIYWTGYFPFSSEHHRPKQENVKVIGNMFESGETTIAFGSEASTSTD